MTSRKIVIRALQVLIGLPILFILLAYGFFYSVFYFPNRTSAVAGTIVSSGQKRDYLLYVPKCYERAKPAPLVITLHSSMSWPSSALAISRWNLVADEYGFIVAFPAGTNQRPEGLVEGFGSNSWEMERLETPSQMPDVIFISQLIDKLEADYNIDKARIYANGMSNGGGMTFVLSCTLSDRIAAVGMVSPGLDPGWWDWCPDRRPVPVVAFHGTADPIVPYNGGSSKLGGGTSPSVPDFMSSWSRRNRCGQNPTKTSLSADVVRLEYTDCADDAAVVFYTIKGEGHQWPGGTPLKAQWVLGPYSRNIDATREMWAFFREHPLTQK